MVRGATGVDGLQVVEQRGALIPRHLVGFLDNIVAIQRGERNRGDVGDIVEARGKVVKARDDVVENGLAEIDEIHFIDRENEVANAQEIRDEGVPLGLLDHSFAGIDEDDGEVGGGGAGDHVASVLDVTGCVGDDEFAPGRGEVAVGDINRDALLALGFQAVGEEREVDHGVAASAGAFLHGEELVLENAFGVVKEAADEGGFAVIDGACGGETKKVHFKKFY